MDLEEIDVFIDKDGQVRVEVRGVKGQSCLSLTRELEKALGDQIAAREMTSEAHEIALDQAPDQQRQGGS